MDSHVVGGLRLKATHLELEESGRGTSLISCGSCRSRMITSLWAFVSPLCALTSISFLQNPTCVVAVEPAHRKWMKITLHPSADTTNGTPAICTTRSKSCYFAIFHLCQRIRTIHTLVIATPGMTRRGSAWPPCEQLKPKTRLTKLKRDV